MKSFFFLEEIKTGVSFCFLSNMNVFFMRVCVCNISESMVPLLPSTAQSQVHMLVPKKTFDLSYDLNCAAICSDFQENIEFQFSLGLKALVHRYLGSVNAQRALKLVDPNLQVPSEVNMMKCHIVYLGVNQPKVEVFIL